MENFSKFYDNLDDEEEEEEEEEEEAEEEAEAAPHQGWELLQSGGLSRVKSVETAEEKRSKKAMDGEAKLLSCLCYQSGLYLPLSAVEGIGRLYQLSLLTPTGTRNRFSN